MAEKRAKRKSRLDWRGWILLTGLIAMGLVFLPTALVLVIGMMPTLIAGLVDRTPGRVKTLTVGAMNLAGCSPYLFRMWIAGQSMEAALEILTDPQNIIVIYFAACLGYMIEWALIGIVSSIVMQKAKFRVSVIEKEQKNLVASWGDEVAATYRLDEYGFRLDDA